MDKTHPVKRKQNLAQLSEREQCRHRGCLNPTSEKKPRCIEHIDELPHAGKITHEISVREDEQLEAAEHPKRVNLSGPTSQDILDALKYRGPFTKERLRMDVLIDAKALNAYIGELAKAGLIRLAKNSRGKTMVHLVAREQSDCA